MILGQQIFHKKLINTLNDLLTSIFPLALLDKMNNNCLVLSFQNIQSKSSAYTVTLLYVVAKLFCPYKVYVENSDYLNYRVGYSLESSSGCGISFSSNNAASIVCLVMIAVELANKNSCFVSGHETMISSSSNRGLQMRFSKKQCAYFEPCSIIIGKAGNIFFDTQMPSNGVISSSIFRKEVCFYLVRAQSSAVFPLSSGLKISRGSSFSIDVISPFSKYC